jgi:predicted ArsR family transcriptional regulator
MRVIKLLVGRPPRTVGELVRETRVTRTAITEQLNEMVARGLVELTIEHVPGRGRPRHLFTATPAAMVLLFANNQQLVVPAIWKAVHDIGGATLTKKVLRSVGRRLSKHYRAKITASEPKKRIEQFKALLRAEGGLVDGSAKNGRITVRKRSCAFISMFDAERRVCAIDLKLMSALAGCRVRQISSRHDGAPCCEFEIKPRAAKRSRGARNGRAKKI